MKDKIDSSQIGPAEASLFRSTDQIRNDVEELLNINDELHLEDLKVDVDGNGVVTLRGRVFDNLQRAEAEDAVWEVLGVTGVVNELEIAS